MCRNIRTLHNFEPAATDEEVRAAALQYVRKISGFTKPSQANAEAFERAVDAVTEVSSRLLAEQLGRRGSDRVDGTLERLGVRPGRVREPADLADVLQRGGADLVFGGGRREVVQRADVAAHAPETSADPVSSPG